MQEQHSGPRSKFPIHVANIYEAKDIISEQQAELFSGSDAAENIAFKLTDMARRRALDRRDPNYLNRTFSGICLIQTADFTELKLSIMEGLTKAGYKGIEISQDMKAGGGDENLCGIRIQFAW